MSQQQQIYYLYFNPFTAKGFPLTSKTRLALDTVKSTSVMSAPTAVKVKGVKLHN